MTNSSVKFCPRCGSANLNFSQLAGGAAVCGNCEWKGTSDDLFEVPFSHDFFSDEGMVRNLMSDIRNLLAGEMGLPYLKFLIKWGFVREVSGSPDRVALTRYLVAIAKAILVGIFNERKLIAEETAVKSGEANAN